ncbi:MAG TPA: class I SAM-dependent methyltransferase [Allosphingosinicella sp.]|nr:class I SAM-dependent methyltransferase [Allosphingosinicella sp.]
MSGPAKPSRRSPFRWFRDVNVAASWATTPHALWETRGFAIYDWVARGLLGEAGVNRVADVGGGRTWYFGEGYRDSNPDFHLIGIDVDPAELALNPMLDEAIATDICESLQVEDGSLDLVLCRATVEHLHDTGAFMANVHRALRPGGKAAFVFAGKWAPPMIMNRIVGHGWANKLLRRLVPGTEGYGGFRAHYDLCTDGAFRRKAEALGFAVEYRYASYYSSSYFQFFLPVHVLSIAGDYLRQILSIRALASMNLFVLRKE